MKLAIILVIALLPLAACQSEPNPTVSSSGQRGGVTANTITTVNQTLPPVVKSPYLKSLQDFFAQGGVISRQWQNIPESYTDKDMAALDRKSAIWVNGTYAWLAKNLSKAAAERFALITPQLATYSLQTSKLSQATQRRFDYWTKAMPQYLTNLDELMRSNAMYPQ